MNNFTYAISTIRSLSWGARAITGRKELALCNCIIAICEIMFTTVIKSKEEKNLENIYHIESSHVLRSGTNRDLRVIDLKSNL